MKPPAKKKTARKPAASAVKPAKSDAPESEKSKKAPARAEKSSVAGGAAAKPIAHNNSFPIVGIGASAGGLEALTFLLRALPDDTGMGFVVVQHLAPTHESMLTEILSKSTSMPVTEVKDGMMVEPDSMYVIPPNTNMALLHGHLNLMPRKETVGHHMPIDYFLRSLAEDQGGRAIGIILSGTASDGVKGLAAIKSEGGITFAQDPQTAKYDGMPRNAIDAGVVDCVLSPEAIAQELVKVSSHPYVSPSQIERSRSLLLEGDDALSKIFILLRASYGVDFTYYKQTTLKRRVIRRMVLHRIESLDNYIKYLQSSPAEIDLLYQDILITVTNFFREPETFDALKEKIFPSLTRGRTAEAPVRIWVPGCSTGEEAYSIAICWLEFLKDTASNIPIQIFATDISDRAIEKARAGIYPENISSDVSPERLRRFFVKTEGGYQISRTIRDMCVFARQNVTKDPPFSRLDLISCRNVLIYLGPLLQKKVIPIFHYALNPSGYLMLGNSETIGTFSDLFGLVDKKHKIYSRKSVSARPTVDFVTRDYGMEKAETGRQAVRTGESLWSSFDLQKEADRIILNRYAPAGVTINEDMEILQFRGRTSLFLEHAPGAASLNLLKMVREDLLIDVRTAIHEAKKRDAAVKKEGLRVKHNGQTREVRIEVVPIKPPLSKERFFLLLLEEVTPGPGAIREEESGKAKQGRGKSAASKQKSTQDEISRLSHELETTKAYLQATVEEQEATNEELRSANEEIQSSNEELQSTNEKLETAKEELQSANEELTTVNEELQNRNFELSLLNNDLNNLLGSINIPVVMLGQDLRIRRFTQPAEKLLNLIPTDAGRPISDIKPNVELPDLERLFLDVLDNLGTIEREVQDRDGHYYSMRIRPYRTADNKIDGAVMAIFDIDALKSSQRQLQESREAMEAILETITPLLILDEHLRVRRATRSFYQFFQLTHEETINHWIYDLEDGGWNIPEMKKSLDEIISEEKRIVDWKAVWDFRRAGRKTLVFKALRIEGREKGEARVFLSIDDADGRA
jgi:two-component system CheB/CheR fusion protein